jgi:hypothetical protein
MRSLARFARKSAHRDQLAVTSFFSATYLPAKNCQKVSGLLKGLAERLSGKLRPA